MALIAAGPCWCSSRHHLLTPPALCSRPDDHQHQTNKQHRLKAQPTNMIQDRPEPSLQSHSIKRKHAVKSCCLHCVAQWQEGAPAMSSELKQRKPVAKCGAGSPSWQLFLARPLAHIITSGSTTAAIPPTNRTAPGEAQQESISCSITCRCGCDASH